MCRLCYDAMQNFGLLTLLWTEMVVFDNGMRWGPALPRQAREGEPMINTAQLVPEQPSRPPPCSTGAATKAGLQLGANQVGEDPDETRLSSQPGREEPRSSTNTPSSVLQMDMEEARRIQESQEHARRLILARRSPAAPLVIEDDGIEVLHVNDDDDDNDKVVCIEEISGPPPAHRVASNGCEEEEDFFSATLNPLSNTPALLT